jgi:hypothetical protein
MADIYLEENNVQSCTITFSREGYFPVIAVVGAKVEIETTAFKDNSIATGNPKLSEQWSGTASSAAEKNDDASKTDIYSRFATTPDETIWDTVDEVNGYTSRTSHKGYRKFINRTHNFDTTGTAISGAGFVETDSTWDRSAKVAGLNARIENSNISYLKFQSGDKGKEYDKRNNNKAFTGIIEGESRIFVQAGTFSETEFKPLLVTTEERFKYQKVYKSYRDRPQATQTNSTARDDTTAAQAYADSLAVNYGVPDISGSVVITGFFQFTIGTMIEKIITNSGASTDLNIGVVDVGFNFNAIRQNGAGVTPDTTTLELGRV